MHLIADICKETGLALDDVRLILADVRQDWATTESVTEPEYQLIKQSVENINAALPEGREIVPVNPEEMALPLQQKLVDNASQVLGFPLAIAAMQEIKMVEVLQSAKNQAILSVVEAKRKELDDVLHIQSQRDQEAFVTTMHELIAICPKKQVNDAGEKMQAGNEATNKTLSELLNLMGK